MNRRTFLQGVSAGSAVGLAVGAGCTDSGPDDESRAESGDDGEATDDAVPAFPHVEDPPDAVYVPTHREAMRMLEPIRAGDYLLAPMLSYPHPFWLVTGRETELVEPDSGPGVHLMITLWDPETETVLPVDPGTRITVEKDGTEVDSRSPWTMISQGMGFHFGDNVPLEGDGTYDVEVVIPPLGVPTTGALEGRFAETATASFEFAYDEEFREAVVGGVEYLDEEYWGERGALEPMAHAGHERDSGHDEGDHDDHDEEHSGDHDNHSEGGHGNNDHDDEGDHDGHGGHDRVPYSAVPPANEFPGEVLGEPETGDAILLTTILEDDSRFSGASDAESLVVSPRTPYNRVPLADMVLRATLTRGDETVAEADLEQTIDGEIGLHYGGAFSELRGDDTLEIAVETPPQIARHQGYETAFLEMPPVEVPIDR